MIGPELRGGAGIIVTLEGTDAVFVHRQRFVVARFAGRRRRWLRRLRPARPAWRPRGPVSDPAWRTSPLLGATQVRPWPRRLSPSVSPRERPCRRLRTASTSWLPRSWGNFLLPGLLWPCSPFGPSPPARRRADGNPNKGSNWTGQGSRRVRNGKHRSISGQTPNSRAPPRAADTWSGCGPRYFRASRFTASRARDPSIIGQIAKFTNQLSRRRQLDGRVRQRLCGSHNDGELSSWLCK